MSAGKYKGRGGYRGRGRPWTEDEARALVRERAAGMTWEALAKKHCRTADSLQVKLRRLRADAHWFHSEMRSGLPPRTKAQQLSALTLQWLLAMRRPRNPAMREEAAA